MIQTTDLILRKGTAEDGDQLYRNLWSRKDVFTYLFSKPSSDPAAGRKRTNAYAQMHQEVETEFFVMEKRSGNVIGIAGLKEMSQGCWTITDLAIGPDYQGFGYGKQILNLLVRLAIDQYDASVVLYHCFEENSVSRGLAVSCGFSYLGSQEAEHKKDGKAVMLACYQISKEAIL